MDSETFWSLCWYDLNLWIENITHRRKQKNDDREFHMELTRHTMSLIANVNGNKTRPTDFMRLSYDDKALTEKPTDEELQERLNRLKQMFPDGK